MALDHLAPDPVDQLIELQTTGFVGQLRREHQLEQEVTQLDRHRRHVALVDRGTDLVRLLDQVGAHRFQCLLAVPRTAIRGAQTGDELDEWGQAAFVHPMVARWVDRRPSQELRAR